jgi:hypothetical protein
MVKEGHTDADILDLVKEAEIMKVRISVPDPDPALLAHWAHACGNKLEVHDSKKF